MVQHSTGIFPYKRILIKLSGEALTADGKTGIDFERVGFVVEQIQHCLSQGLQVCIVIGGGNLLRGRSLTEFGVERTAADYMGMLATVINALALGDAFEKAGLESRVMTAFKVPSAEFFVRKRALKHLERGRIVIFAGGTGSPFFTTDTAAALRAVEVGCDVILKATKVDGVYEADPLNDATARKFAKISYLEALQRRLQVMDSAALSLCMDNALPVIIFDIFERANLSNLLQGAKVGTLISATDGFDYA